MTEFFFLAAETGKERGPNLLHQGGGSFHLMTLSITIIYLLKVAASFLQGELDKKSKFD